MMAQGVPYLEKIVLIKTLVITLVSLVGVAIASIYLDA